MAFEEAEPRVLDRLLVDTSMAGLSATASEASSRLEAEGSPRQVLVAASSGRRRMPWSGVAAGGMLAITMVMGVHVAVERVGSGGAFSAASARSFPARTISTEEVKVPAGTEPSRQMLLIDEERGCYTKGTYYWPIDMFGAIPLAAKSAAECQDRCAKKSGCKHFSYDSVSMVCHLEDASAKPQDQALTFISGPVVCPATTSTTTATTVTTVTSSTQTTATATTTMAPSTTTTVTAMRTTTTVAATTTTTAPSTTTTAPSRTTTAASTTTTVASTTTEAPTTTQATTTTAPTTSKPTSAQATTAAPTTSKPATTQAAPAAAQRAGNATAEYAPSFFCFLILMPTGYEPELVRAQVIKRAGVFSCKEYSTFSIAKLDLGSGIFTTMIGAGQSKKGSWGSWLNTENFLQAWDKILADGRFRKTDWTVKADPDCVFFPDRLQLHLQKLFPDGVHGTSYYIKNCPKDFGLMGSLEVFSTGAIDAYAGKKDECHAKFNPGGSGEDGYMQACMKYSGVEGKEDFELLADHYCGFGKCEGNQRNVAFHPFKDTDLWFQCWAQVVAAS